MLEAAYNESNWETCAALFRFRDRCSGLQKPDQQAFHFALRSFGQLGRWAQALEVLSELLQVYDSPKPFIFESLIETLCIKGQVGGWVAWLLIWIVLVLVDAKPCSVTDLTDLSG